METASMIENVPFCYIANKVEGDSTHPHLFVAINSKYKFQVPEAVSLGKVHNNIMKRELQIKREYKKKWFESKLSLFDIPIVPSNKEQTIDLDEIKVTTKINSDEKFVSTIILQDEDFLSSSGSSDELLK